MQTAAIVGYTYMEGVIDGKHCKYIEKTTETGYLKATTEKFPLFFDDDTNNGSCVINGNIMIPYFTNLNNFIYLDSSSDSCYTFKVSGERVYILPNAPLNDMSWVKEASFKNRIYHTIVGHPHRSLLGVVLTTSFLCLILLPPTSFPFYFLLSLTPFFIKLAFGLENLITLKLGNGSAAKILKSAILLAPFLYLYLLIVSPVLFPFSFLTTMALGVQNLITSKFGVSLAAKILFPTIGGFLVLTAPKWVGNVCQLIGKRLIEGIVGRIILSPTVLFQKTFPKYKKANRVLSSLFFIPWALVSITGIVINIIGSFLAGEVSYRRRIGILLSSKEKDKKDNSVNRILKKLINLTNPATVTTKFDPPIFLPPLRLWAAKKYDHLMNSLGEKVKDIPSFTRYLAGPPKIKPQEFVEEINKKTKKK